MEIVCIELTAFEAMEKRFSEFADKIQLLCNKRPNQSLSKWLDNQEVCVLLNISKRTLQSYRDNGTLAYTQIGNKMYYKPEDVEKALIRQNFQNTFRQYKL